MTAIHVHCKIDARQTEAKWKYYTAYVKSQMCKLKESSLKLKEV